MDAAALIAIRLRDCAQRLQDAGYGFDVVNDAALPRRLLVFYKTESVPVATMCRIRDWNIPVIAVGSLPRAPVGLKEWKEQRRQFGDLVEDIWKRGRGVLVPDLDALQDWLDRNITPDFRSTIKEVGYIHRRAGASEIYFVANDSERDVQADLTFRAAGANVQRWDPMDGSIHSVADVRVNGARTTVPATLGPRGSAVFVFNSSAQPAAAPAAASTALSVTGPWRVSFPEPLNRTYTWERLQDWATVSETKHFSGLVSYGATITVTVEVASAVIDLGDVRDSAEVFINGRPAGVAFMRPYHVRTGGLFKPGSNTIEIRVANLWNNAVMAMPRTVTRVPGPGYGITDVLYGPRERKLAPSGLLGPVRLLL